MPSTIPGPITDVDLVGLLIGDVTGNWNPTIHPRGEVQLANGSEAMEKIAVDLPKQVTPAGNEVFVPVRIQGVTGKDVISYEFDLRYDPTVILPLSEPVEVWERLAVAFHL